MLQDQEWDTIFIFTKKLEDYLPNMENFFRVALDKEYSDKPSM